ncbi:hypothetical protein ACFE04_020055 [Oxalis oulophora]
MDDEDDTTPTPNYAYDGKIMLCSLILVIFLLIFIYCFNNMFCRILFHNRRRSRAHQNSSSSSSVATASVVNVVCTTRKGLDVSVIKKIPTITININSTELLECSVCLSDFQHGERARVLPKCNHTFHLHCIDTWFSSHSTCPLCRAPVHLPPDPDQVVVDLDGLMTMMTLTAPPGIGRAKSFQVFGSLYVDDDEEGNNSISQRVHGFELPGKRVLTLKRIWSV